MAITTELLGPIGVIRGYASSEAEPDVTYKLPPAPYGWVTRATGSGVITIHWVDLSTGRTLHSFRGVTAGSGGTGTRTSGKPEVQQLATTVGIGVRFTGPTTIRAVGIAPLGPDGDAYAMPPT